MKYLTSKKSGNRLPGSRNKTTTITLDDSTRFQEGEFIIVGNDTFRYIGPSTINTNNIHVEVIPPRQINNLQFSINEPVLYT